MIMNRVRIAMRPRLGSLALLPLIVLATGGCSGGAGSDTEERVGQLSEELFFPNGTLLWNDNQLGVGTTLPVCFSKRPIFWDSGAGDTWCAAQTSDGKDCEGNPISASQVSNFRELVKRQIDDTWGRAANLTFLWNGDCPVDAGTGKHLASALQHTMVVVPSNADFTNILGKSLAFPTGISLNWAPVLSGDDRFNLIHEFGHALGFEHEWLRQDYPNECGQAREAGTYLTPTADLDSIMRYDCPGGVVNDYFLSAGDVMGVQKAYGRKPTGSLVGYRGQCANIAGGGSANLTPLIGWPCTGGWNDTWSRAADAKLHFQTSTPKKCMNVLSQTAPNPLISYDCVTADNERFTTTGVQIRAMGNMCLQANGGKVELRPCGTLNLFQQKWDLFNDTTGRRFDQIRRNGTTSCLSSTTTNGALGEELVYVACSSTDSKQRFVYPGNGIIALANNPSLCLNVAGGLPVSGSKLILWDGCWNPPPQNSQFSISGQIKSLGACMSLTGAGNPGDAIWAQTCNSDPATYQNQIWEYYL